MTKVRHRPVLIDAVRWDGEMETIERFLSGWAGYAPYREADTNRLVLQNHAGEANVGDWVLRDADDNLSVMSNEQFLAKYEDVSLYGGVT